MGMINCLIHGYRGITLVCPHIRKKFLNHEILENITEVKEQFSFDDEEDFIPYWFCEECVTRYALPTDGRIISSEDWSRQYGEAYKTLEALCSQCFLEAIRSDVHSED